MQFLEWDWVAEMPWTVLDQTQGEIAKFENLYGTRVANSRLLK